MSEAKTITDVLKEATGDVLTEETLSQIEGLFSEAVDTKVAIHVEKALVEQDETHAGKLGDLLEAIDKDHTNKLEKVVEAIDKNHAQKLVQLVKRYESSLNEEAGDFKTTLVESISSYIEEYIDEKIPVTEIEEAVKNKKATKVLSSLRNTLGVDFALSKETIKHAITEGKQQIDQSQENLKKLADENNTLTGKVDALNTHILLTEKTKDLPEQKADYLYKVLSDKSVDFITENFDYTLRLFDKSEEDRLMKYKQEAVASREPEVDRPIVESTDTEEATTNTEDISSPFQNSIMAELNKF